MKEIISFGVLGWMFAFIFAVILIAVLFYYLVKVNPDTCKNACMGKCRACRRNCKGHDSAIAIDERFRNNKAMSEMMKVM